MHSIKTTNRYLLFYAIYIVLKETFESRAEIVSSLYFRLSFILLPFPSFTITRVYNLFSSLVLLLYAITGYRYNFSTHDVYLENQSNFRTAKFSSTNIPINSSAICKHNTRCKSNPRISLLAKERYERSESLEEVGIGFFFFCIWVWSSFLVDVTLLRIKSQKIYFNTFSLRRDANQRNVCKYRWVLSQYNNELLSRR